MIKRGFLVAIDEKQAIEKWLRSARHSLKLRRR
jgi:hypothetical protein